MRLADIDASTEGAFFRCLHDEVPEDSRVITGRTTLRASLILAVALAMLCQLSGYSFIGASIMARRQHLNALPTRRLPYHLCLEAPGSMITAKPRHDPSVSGQFIGLSWPDTSSSATAPCSTAVLLLQDHWKRISLPLKDIKWVQTPQPDAPVLIAFGIGLVIDVSVLWYVSRSFSGLAAVGD